MNSQALAVLLRIACDQVGWWLSITILGASVRVTVAEMLILVPVLRLPEQSGCKAPGFLQRY